MSVLCLWWRKEHIEFVDSWHEEHHWRISQRFMDTLIYGFWTDSYYLSLGGHDGHWRNLSILCMNIVLCWFSTTLLQLFLMNLLFMHRGFALLSCSLVHKGDAQQSNEIKTNRLVLLKSIVRLTSVQPASPYIDQDLVEPDKFWSVYCFLYKNRDRKKTRQEFLYPHHHCI